MVSGTSATVSPTGEDSRRQRRKFARALGLHAQHRRVEAEVRHELEQTAAGGSASHRLAFSRPATSVRSCRAASPAEQVGNTSERAQLSQ